MWRLKVINSCVHNDDLVLPVAPQPSVLQQFYTYWRDEDEKINQSANAFCGVKAHTITTGKRRGKKRSYKVKRTSPNTTLSDWVNRIPHVALGRHTSLPASYRLRHPCASRLHCRVAYIADATTHKQVLSTYPAFHQTSEKLQTEGDVMDVDSDGTGSDDIMGEAHGVFSGPHYRILNCGSNPVYINSELLPRGRSRRLREQDIIAFLENPFDEEGGVLEPLRPGDITAGQTRHTEGSGRVGMRQASPAIVEEGAVSWLLATSTARALFTGTNGNDTNSSANGGSGSGGGGNALIDLRASLLSGERRDMQSFVEVNGIRVARRRLPCVPVNANATVSSSVVDALSPRRGASLAVEHNRLVAMRESESLEGKGVSEHELPLTNSPLIDNNHKDHSDSVTPQSSKNVNTLITPPPKSIEIPLTLPYPEDANAASANAFLHNANFADDDCMDIVEGVVSPLQQRYVASPNRKPWRTTAVSGSEPERLHTTSLSAVSARLPVYVFARRSPSPQGFTRQAPSIGRLHARSHTRVAEDEESEGKEKEESQAEEEMSGGEEVEAKGKEKESVERDAGRIEKEAKSTAKGLTRQIRPTAKKQKRPLAKRTRTVRGGAKKQTKPVTPHRGERPPKEKVTARKDDTGSSVMSVYSENLTILDIERLKRANKAKGR